MNAVDLPVPWIHFVSLRLHPFRLLSLLCIFSLLWLLFSRHWNPVQVVSMSFLLYTTIWHLYSLWLVVYYLLLLRWRSLYLLQLHLIRGWLAFSYVWMYVCMCGRGILCSVCCFRGGWVELARGTLKSKKKKEKNGREDGPRWVDRKVGDH